MKNRKHEDEKKEKAEVGLVAARENFEAIATLLAKLSNEYQLRLGKSERIFGAPLSLSGIPKLIRQSQTVQIGA